MPLSYFVHPGDKDQYQISGEVLYKHYIGDKRIKNITADAHTLSIEFEAGANTFLTVVSDADATVTYRYWVPRRR